uniref:N-acetyltransferase domain-containing protein n=1 Tax=Mycena chlorophos TaxID=658473 RepID=A0ABQ0L2E3_MYCCL|nr:predicted protein [Mycena chlorophos]
MHPPSISIRRLGPSKFSGAGLCPGFDPANPARTLPEYASILSLLTRALDGDEFMAAASGRVVGDRDRSFYELFLMAPIVAQVLGGEIYIAETQDKRIVGISGWFGPGHSLCESEEEIKYALAPFMRSLSIEMQDWWQESFLPEWDRWFESALGSGVKHNSWHLLTLAVDPDFQRRGIGRMLVDVVAEQARPHRTPLCVETTVERNLPFYENLGFKLLPRRPGRRTVDKETSRHVFVGIAEPERELSMWLLVRGFE